MAKTTILFLASNPRDSSRLRLDHEMRDVRQQLRLSKQRDDFLITSREAVRASDITQAIHDTNPNIVHFSGHGTDEGQLCIEDSHGKAQVLLPSALTNLFKVVQKVNLPQVMDNCGQSLTPTLIKKTTNPSFLYGNDVNSSNLVFQKRQDNSRVQLPISQLRKHLAVIGWTGSGRSYALHWLASTLLNQHNISFLWIGHWFELSRGISDKISHRKIEDNTHDESNLRADTTSKLNSIMNFLKLDHLSNHPTVVEIDSNDYSRKREAFKVVFETILKSLGRNPQTNKLRLVIIVDELDEIYKNDESSFDISEHFYSLRKCGIGIVFTCSSFECVDEHVRNFIALPMSGWAYQIGETKFKELANTQKSIIYRRERGEAILSARGIIEPVLVCIPKLQPSS